jgi:hypothetical protein
MKIIRLLVSRALEIQHLIGYVSVNNADSLIEQFETEDGYLIKPYDIIEALQFEFDPEITL